jgi:alpha-galactosidase
MQRREFVGNILAAPAFALGIRRVVQPLADESNASGLTLGAEPRVTERGNVVELDNGLVRRTVTLGEDGGLTLDSLRNLRTGFDWAAPGEPADIYLQMGKTVMTGFQPGMGFRFVGHRQQKLNNGAIELSIETVQETTQAKVTLFYTIFPASPVIEHRLTIENQGGKPLPPISRFDPLTFWLRGDQGSLQACSLGGSENTDLMTPRLAESVQRRTLDSTLAITGFTDHKPWFILENTEWREFLFVGVGWTVDWGLRLLRQNRRVLLTSGILESVHELEPGQKLESPSIFAGLVGGELDDAVNTMHGHMKKYVSPPMLKDFPWVDYNFWFTEPGDMEGALHKEADFAADLGVECFYHDASWCEGADKRGSGLWGQGLGSYEAMKARFPHGLRALSDYVHNKGMRFGIWVDPANVDPVLVGNKLPAKWLAQHDGLDCVCVVSVWKPDPRLRRLCLGCPEVVEYLKKSLAGIIEKWNIDWLKWDPSGGDPFRQVCNRTDHGHQKGNGAYADLRGEEKIYQHLLEKFPKLVIERCRGADGLAAYSRDFPVIYEECPRHETDNIARRSVIEASYWFSGGFGTSHISDRPDPIPNRPDLKPNGFLLKTHSKEYLDYLFRTFMMTGFGFGTLDGAMSQRISRWHPDVIAAVRRNIEAFKKYRHLLSGDVYHLAPLGPLYFPDPGNTEQWDILEYAKEDGSEAVTFFFRGAAKDSTWKTTLKGLRSDAEYGVTSLNRGELTRVSGGALLEQGVEVSLPEENTSEILLIAPV